MRIIGVTREPLSRGQRFPSTNFFLQFCTPFLTEKLPLSYSFYWLLNRNQSQDQNVSLSVEPQPIGHHREYPAGPQ